LANVTLNDLRQLTDGWLLLMHDPLKLAKSSHALAKEANFFLIYSLTLVNHPNLNNRSLVENVNVD